MKPSLLYRFLRSYCSAGLWFYFRQWQVVGRENVPAQGPLIYIANHQNAFLDAILMTCAAERSPFYLARAGVFSKPWAARLLSLVHIKPIYRFRDGFSTLKNNDVVMQDCVDLMKQNEVILLFPEGNHNEPWSLRAFQKGFARLAMLYRNQTNGAPLHIVPMGIHYTQHHNFNSRVLVSVGKALSVNQIVSVEKTERENLDALVAAGQHAVQQLVLDIKPESEYHARQQYLVENRRYQADMYDQFNADKEVASQFPSKQNSVAQPGVLYKAFAAVLRVLVFATHGLPYWGISNLIKSKIKDPQFISSVKYAVGIFGIPLYYTILFFLGITVFGSAGISFIVVLCLPVLLVLSSKVLPTR